MHIYKKLMIVRLFLICTVLNSSMVVAFQVEKSVVVADSGFKFDERSQPDQYSSVEEKELHDIIVVARGKRSSWFSLLSSGLSNLFYFGDSTTRAVVANHAIRQPRQVSVVASDDTSEDEADFSCMQNYRYTLLGTFGLVALGWYFWHGQHDVQEDNNSIEYDTQDESILD